MKISEFNNKDIERLQRMCEVLEMPMVDDTSQINKKVENIKLKLIYNLNIVKNRDQYSASEAITASREIVQAQKALAIVEDICVEAMSDLSRQL